MIYLIMKSGSGHLKASDSRAIDSVGGVGEEAGGGRRAALGPLCEAGVEERGINIYIYIYIYIYI